MWKFYKVRKLDRQAIGGMKRDEPKCSIPTKYDVLKLHRINPVLFTAGNQPFKALLRSLRAFPSRTCV